MPKTAKNSHQQNKLFRILLLPIYLYFGVYILSLLIAILNGGRPVLISLLTNNFQDDGIRLYALRNAGVFYNVATKEIEDCDTNPMEYYPEGYVDRTREYGRGLIYAYDMFKISRFGMPERNVESGNNCQANSQKIMENDLAGKFTLRSMTILAGLQNWTSPTGVEHNIPSQVQKSYDSKEYFLEMSSDAAFSFGFGCVTFTGEYQLEQDKLLLTKITNKVTCKADQLTPEQVKISEAFPTFFNLVVNPSTIQLSNLESGLSFTYLK